MFAFAFAAHGWAGYDAGLWLLAGVAVVLCLIDTRAAVWLFIGTQALDAYGFVLEEPFRLSVSRIVVVALVAGVVLRWLRMRELPTVRLTVFDLGVLLFMAGVAVSVPGSYTVKTSAVGAVQVAFLVAAYFVLSRVAVASDGRRNIRSALMATGALSGLLALGQTFVPGFPLPIVEQTLASAADAATPARAAAFFGNPNTMALLLVVSALLAVESALRAAKPGARAGYALVAAVSVAGIGVSYSRAALVGIVVGLVALAMLLLQGAKRRLIGLAAIVLVLALMLAIPGVGQRALSIVDFRGDASAMDRVYLSQVSLKMFAARPLTGVGIEAFRAAYPSFPDPRVTVDPVTDGHQMVFSVPAELGVLGLAAELLLAGALLWLLVRALRDDALAPYAGALAALVAIGAMAFFNTFVFFETFWIAVGLVGAAFVVPRD